MPEPEWIEQFRNGNYTVISDGRAAETHVDSDSVDEYRFYVYEQCEDDPRYALYLSVVGAGELCIYDRPPEGAGMWHSTEQASDHSHIDPSDTLVGILGRLADGERIHVDELEPLAGHERHFVQVVHGTVAQADATLPGEAREFLTRCRDQMEGDDE